MEISRFDREEKIDYPLLGEGERPAADQANQHEGEQGGAQRACGFNQVGSQICNHVYVFS